MYIPLNSVSQPYILFVGPIILEPLDTYSHKVLQGINHLVYFLGVVTCWCGVVLITGSFTSPVVVLWLVIYLFLVSSGFICVHLGLECLQMLGKSQYFPCSWVIICDSIKLMLMRFAIASLSSIFAISIVCSAPSVKIWASIYCALFYAETYPCASAVDFFWIW